MRINAAVAMDMDFTLPSGQRFTRKYRASASKNNWAGATGEYMTTLNYALNNVLGKLANDLQKMCGGTFAANDPIVSKSP
jgi:hypothetical protein